MAGRGVFEFTKCSLPLIQAQIQVRISTDVNPLLDTAGDYFRFVTEFFEIISRSGTHIYHSAIQLAPRSSIVRKLYNEHIHSPMLKIVTGVPDLWDSCTASVVVTGVATCAVWSPCGRLIAVLLEHSGSHRIEVRDSNTLEVVSILQPPTGVHRAFSGRLAFSPDERLLAHYNCG